jgi:HAD superfamily hydrolase (TIGR01549 family)
MTDRWVVLDVGETLIDETRIWSAWPDELGIPPLTFFAALGAVIERGQEHTAVFDLFGLGQDGWRRYAPAVEARHGGFKPDDLYPDALPCLAALRDAGFRLAVIANQPVPRHQQLLALGVEAEVIAMSDEMDLFKPDPAFFDRTLELLGAPDPADVAYVGDRVDNDVLPAIAAGMRAIWIRRGPWGVIHRMPEGTRPALVVDTLEELADRIGEAWPDRLS